ncbi:hypothetical protein B0H17DRAFT_934493 [Mycena rosella]|uniref:Uncharacterized protein n=1 Tax=Mycena rosella TaxID=1033263 RepID=A0AAD7GKB1_MYCRO|nr:hypothetical protein B0H17DRAFT_934493 [Mycena rosella]
MPSQHTTIASASQPHIRHTDPAPCAPLTSEEKKEKQVARKLKQEQIDTTVGEWFAYTYAKATELAERFGRTQRHFLNTFFQGSAHMVHHQENVNAYNAFKSEKAAKCREQGEPKAAPELHRDFHAEYTALTEEEKQEYVDRFIDTRSREVKIRKATPRGRIQDLANTVRNMQLLMVGLGHRVGIEGFFCIVRNNADFNTKPQWYFTFPELESYMQIACRKRWDTAETGMKIEAFAIAGCNVLSK